MDKAPVRIKPAYIQATHFQPDGNLIYEPTFTESKNPKSKKPEKKGLFSFLRLREELKHEPQGPKEVLEEIEEKGLMERGKYVNRKLFEMAVEDISTGDEEYKYFEIESPEMYGPEVTTVNLVNFEKRKIAGNGSDNSHVEMPPQVAEIIRNINKASVSMEKDSIYSLKMKGPKKFEIRTINGIRINLSLPDDSSSMSDKALHFRVDPPDSESSPLIEQELRRIEEKFSNKDALLEISEEITGYSEKVVAMLSWENAEIGVERKIETRTLQLGEFQQTPQQQKLMEEMREKHLDNPLFNTDFREVPENYHSVFYSISERRLQECANKGLEPSTDFYLNPDLRGKELVTVEQLFNQAAPEGFSRTRSVFAYPDLSTLLGSRSGGSSKPGEIIMELKVPENVLVSDQAKFTEVVEYFRMIGNTGGVENDYWADAMKLKNYLNLSQKERKTLYHFPEVIIPGVIKPEFMRIAGVVAKY